jgi:hypothetical protein
MAKLISFIGLMMLVWISSGQQITINRVEMMPSLPQPYLLRDWIRVAQNYDSLVFNTGISGQYLPLVAVNENGINYPEHSNVAMISYVGQTLETSAEAINYMPALIGASLSGIDKSNQFGQNWVLMAEDFFNLKPEENVYLNGYSASSGDDWWYETMPNIFFYQLNALYPNTGDFNYQFITVADRWLEAVGKMGGNATPWEAPYMNYRAWNLSQMKPLTEGVTEPEASGAIGWILYNAYQQTNEKKYLVGAEWALEFLSGWNENPSYEIQLPYGAYTAARMNAELGTNYNIDKIINWCFDKGSLRDWGCIVGKWGNYDCSGLIGEANDGGDDYAFIMNGFQQASALVPLVRYNEQYANAIGKWMLNLANASRLFYPGFLPADQQDSEDWAQENDINNCIAHEAMKEKWDNQSPFSTGDAIRGGWASTNLALYGASHVGYFGGIISTTNVDAILKLDLCKTDFYATSYPTFLLWNPYNTDTTVSMNVGNNAIDIYNSIANTFIYTNVNNIVDVVIPASSSVILVYVSKDAQIEYNRQKTIANTIVIDFDNGIQIDDHPPRIKALSPLKNPVAIGDSIKIYCTADDIDNDAISYSWSVDNTPFEGDAVLSFKPSEQTLLKINCKITSGSVLSDTMSITVEVKDRIPYFPEIKSLKANPGKIDREQNSTLFCEVSEENGDALTYEWFASQGTLIGDGEQVQWNSPDAVGDYKIYCSVSDMDGTVKDSVVVMVRDLSKLQKGDPVLYLPFNGNVNDYSPSSLLTSSYGINYLSDAFNNVAYAAAFNGSSSYVNVKNSDALNFKSALTLTGWIYSGYEGGGEAYPISHGNWDNRWKISLANNTLRFTVKTNIGIADLDTKTLLNNGEWYHFAIIYTGTDLEIYLNGQLDSFLPFTGEIATTSYDLVLGKARPDQEFYFKGRLDDITLFNHALSPTNVKDMYDFGVGIENPESSLGLIEVFPNPASVQLNIHLSNVDDAEICYQLFDVSGRAILCGKWFENEKMVYNIPLTNVQSGIYFLNIQSGKVLVTEKIMVTK